MRGARVAFVSAAVDGGIGVDQLAIDAGMLRDNYELEYVWVGNDRVEWTLLKSQMQRSQHGSYALHESADGTEVTYSLTVELALPMLGLLKRKAEKMVMDTALKELKRHVEAQTG